MVEDDISKLHIDKKGMAVRRGRKKRLLLLVLLLVVVAGAVSFTARSPYPGPHGPGGRASKHLPVPDSRGPQRQRYAVAQRKAARVLQDHGSPDFLVVEEESRVKKEK